MNGQEIIEMAQEAGFTWSGADLTWESYICTEELEAFAKLIANKEREACIVDIQMHIPRSGRDTVEYKMAMRMIERIKARA
jgi:predicted secreted protein